MTSGASIRFDPGGGDLMFHEVGFDEVARVPGPHFHRAQAFVLWVLGPDLAGIFPTAPQRLPDLDPIVELYIRLFGPEERRSYYQDLRGFGAEGGVFDAILSAARAKVEAAAAHAERSAMVLPHGWTKAWWVGVLEMGVMGATEARPFGTPAEAWHWLGAPPAVLPAVERLRATHDPDSLFRDGLVGVLVADPSLSIEGAARRLGISSRALQRALAASRETFVAVRSRVRAEVAVRRLRETDDKLEAVAAEAGFRSRSHFVAWFRRVVGQTPDRFRRERRTDG